MKEDAIIKCKDLKPHLNKISIELHVLSKEEPKTVRSKRDRTSHRMSEVLIGDETGTVLMTLWDENVDQLSAGKTYFITNAFTTLFQGTVRLNIGKYGVVKEVERKIDVDTKNNVSEKRYEEPRRFSEYDKFSSGSFWPDH